MESPSIILVRIGIRESWPSCRKTLGEVLKPYAYWMSDNYGRLLNFNPTRNTNTVN